MRFKCFLYAAAVSVLAVSCKTSDINEKLNAQARAEYLQPIHPGSADGSVSFWNAYATKFIYAPAFDFKAVEGVKPYENMTNCTAAPVAIYLMMKDNPSESDLRTAEELVRFCEDQFVYWNSERVDGVPVTNTSCAYEQYKWKEPTDASTSYILSCFVLMYKHTGDELWLAKASALAANITFMQNKVTGMIPTWGWRNSRLHNTDADKFWINCTRHSVATLKLFKEITGQE